MKNVDTRTAYIDLIKQVSLPDQIQQYSTESLCKIVDSLLEHSGLLPFEARFVIMRFGIEDNQQRTLKEIGTEYRLSGERVRQIINKAIRKIAYVYNFVVLNEDQIQYLESNGIYDIYTRYDVLKLSFLAESIYRGL